MVAINITGALGHTPVRVNTFLSKLADFLKTPVPVYRLTIGETWPEG